MHLANQTQDKQLRFLVEETWDLESLKETSKPSNSIWIQPLRPSNQLLIKINLGTSKMLAHLPTCRSGKPMEDGSKCSNTLGTNSKTKEECMFQCKTKKILL